MPVLSMGLTTLACVKENAFAAASAAMALKAAAVPIKAMAGRGGASHTGMAMGAERAVIANWLKAAMVRGGIVAGQGLDRDLRSRRQGRRRRGGKQAHGPSPCTIGHDDDDDAGKAHDDRQPARGTYLFLQDKAGECQQEKDAGVEDQGHGGQWRIGVGVVQGQSGAGSQNATQGKGSTIPDHGWADPQQHAPKDNRGHGVA